MREARPQEGVSVPVQAASEADISEISSNITPDGSSLEGALTGSPTPREIQGFRDYLDLVSMARRASLQEQKGPAGHKSSNPAHAGVSLYLPVNLAQTTE